MYARGFRHFVTCYRCKINGGTSLTESGAIKKWNLMQDKRNRKSKGNDKMENKNPAKYKEAYAIVLQKWRNYVDAKEEADKELTAYEKAKEEADKLYES